MERDVMFLFFLYPTETTTQRPYTDRPGKSGQGPREPDDIFTKEMKKVVHFDGQSYLEYDFNRIDRRFLRVVNNEEFEFLLATYDPDGLIWFTDNPKRTMHLSLRVSSSKKVLDRLGGNSLILYGEDLSKF